MADLLAELSAGSPASGLTFTGQDINPETEGRPDLVATDATGVRLIIEAKFDAALTPAQTSGAYVDKLTPNVPGALVFLVPRDRMRNLWRTVSVTPGGAAAPADLTTADADAGIVHAPIAGTSHVIAVVSWESLLHRLEAATTKYGDTEGSSELAQVKGLVKWRTNAGWVPLAPDDLPQRVGRQLRSLVEVLKSVCGRASQGKTRNGSGDGGFGRYITTPSGKTIWVGLWNRWWDDYGPGPAWAEVKLTSPQQVALLSSALTAAEVLHEARAQYRDVLIPLTITVGAEEAAVEEHLLTQVNAVMAVLDAQPVEAVDEGDSEAVGEGDGADASPV